MKLAFAAVWAAALLAVVRILGERSPVFQAAAHLVVGALFAAGFAGPKYRGVSRWFWFGVAAALCVVEVVCFFAFRR